MANVRVYSVSAVELELSKSDPPQLAIVAHGYAVTSGWTDAKLVPLEKKLSADGILDVEFVATPPGGINRPVLTPVTAQSCWQDDAERIVAVRVVARSNELIRFVPHQPPGATTEPVGEETTQIAGEGQHPHFAAAQAAMTTMIVGEEGPPQITTMIGGEEATTHMYGEEGGGLPPTTHMLGEEGGGLPPTTHMLGEEGGGLPPTTDMLGEEGGGLPPTTKMLGEEGGGLPPTTTMLSEEGGGVPPTTHMLGEEGGGLPPTTKMLGEEGGGLPPLPTTAPLLEETTQMVGEGATTMPFFEELMPGPVIPGTSPTTDDPKPPFGEGWIDPANQNPLGRR